MVKLDLDTWLKPEDVAPESTLVFISEGGKGEIPGEEGKPATSTFEILVSLPNGENRIWTMNRTSQRAVAQSYGADTKAWVGKTVQAYITSQNVRGTMKEVIYARVP